eukprot:scaffold76338_cov55-Phaeocystis_antarctica.AAC.2
MTAATAARAARAAAAAMAARAAPWSFPQTGELPRAWLRTLRVRPRAPPRASQYEHGAPRTHQWMAATWTGRVLLAPTLPRRRRCPEERRRWRGGEGRHASSRSLWRCPDVDAF